jgi:CRISPR-associated protein Cas2
MLIVTYDISNDKLRTKFSKFLEKYGRRIQYSVFEIKNSERILNNILIEIEKKFAPKFEITDSILIFPINPNCSHKIYRY